MPRDERKVLIRALADERQTNVIAYVTSTRSNLESPMAMDVVPFLYGHLSRLPGTKKDRKIDLFLHSNGGDGVVPWRLATLIREFCDEFTLLVPNRAFSAGTLLALGADTVIMHPMGMLGPTDPTVTNPFNPRDEQNPNQLLGISVEDVTSYIALVKDDVGIRHEDELIDAFRVLADKVHPLALGNVKRSTSQSRMMGEKLLRSRQKEDLDDHEISEIIRKLTSELYYHGHPINRREAHDDLGLTFVEDATDAVAARMWDLFTAYEADLRLNEEWAPIQEAIAIHGVPAVPAINPQTGGSVPTVDNVSLPSMLAALLESVSTCDTLELGFEVTMRREWSGKLEANIALVRREWLTEEAEATS